MIMTTDKQQLPTTIWPGHALKHHQTIELYNHQAVKRPTYLVAVRRSQAAIRRLPRRLVAM